MATPHHGEQGQDWWVAAEGGEAENRHQCLSDSKPWVPLTPWPDRQTENRGQPVSGLQSRH